jgi:hypothetical protein
MKEIMKIIIGQSIDAIVVVISALRCHGRCGDVGRDLHVHFVANEGLRVKSEGLSHQASDAVTVLVKSLC